MQLPMLSVIEASDFAITVVSDDVSTLKKLPGVSQELEKRGLYCSQS